MTMGIVQKKSARPRAHGKFLRGESVLLCVSVVLFWVFPLDWELRAQEPPPTQEPVVVPDVSRPDPLRESALSRALQELAQKPLPADETRRRELLGRVFSFIEGIPVNVVEQGAFKYRRARIRLTEDARRETRQDFRLTEDLRGSPERYWGRPVAFHGSLTNLRPISAPDAGQEAFEEHEGALKLWNEDVTVRFVARRLPDDLSAEKNVPMEVVGYLFSTKDESNNTPAPLVVARSVRRLKPELDLRTLVSVKDRTIGIPEEEADAYYRTLLHARLMDESDLKKQADEFWSERQKQLGRPRPVFVDLFKTFAEDPNIYRGRVVTLEGTLRKLRQIIPDPLNNFGIEILYEAWIFAEDSQSNPTVVVFAENSSELPEGDDLNIPVRVTGYVFKMYGYESRDEKHPLRIAPMLLAKTVKKVAITESGAFPLAWVAGAIGLLCLGIVLFVWSSNREDKQFREKIIRKDEPEEPPKFDHLNEA